MGRAASPRCYRRPAPGARKIRKGRCPAYPLIPLEAAIERLTAFEAHFKRSAARPHKVGDAWGIKAKAYADRTRAALRYFGLIEYQGSGKHRQVIISDEGRKYLRAQQEETKREVLRAAALRPKQIAKYWGEWGEDRPEDAACLDDLVFKNDFSEEGARKFLKVYDGADVKALAPNVGELGTDHAQASGTIRIPARCVTRVRRLRVARSRFLPPLPLGRSGRWVRADAETLRVSALVSFPVRSPLLAVLPALLPVFSFFAIVIVLCILSNITPYLS